MSRTVVDKCELFVRVLNALNDPPVRLSESKLIGGYEWCMAQEAVNTTARTVKLTLHWNCPPVGNHNCVANVSFYVKRLLKSGRREAGNYETIDLAEHNEVTFTTDSITHSATLSVDDYDCPLMVAKVELLSEVKPRSNFAAPTSRTDCVLKIGSRHFYLEKAVRGVLMRHIHHNVFRHSSACPNTSALFSGKYIEGDHEVISIEDVDPQEFLWMLQTSEGSLPITGDNVEGMLRVADRFLVGSVLKQCDHFLLTSPTALGEKLLLADLYGRKECFEKLLTFVRGSEHLKKVSEESKLKGELSRSGLEMLYEVALKLGHAKGREEANNED